MIKICADAGMEACPCALAESGNCLVCRRLGASAGKPSGGNPSAGNPSAGNPSRGNPSGGKPSASSQREAWTQPSRQAEGEGCESIRLVQSENRMTAKMTVQSLSQPSEISEGPGLCNGCSWQGMCIYTLYVQNMRKKVAVRQKQICRIKEIKDYSSSFRVFILEVPKGLCQRAERPGSFVFVKRQNDPDWFDMPVSVLKADSRKCELHLGICGCGPKSTRLLQGAAPVSPALAACSKPNSVASDSQAPAACGGAKSCPAPAVAQVAALEIRGVYYNGLTGLGNLNPNADGAMVYGKGIAIAPLRNLMDQKVIDPKTAHFCLDPSKIEPDFIKDYFGDIPVENLEIREFASEGFNGRGLKKERGNVLALVSPYYCEKIEVAAGRRCLKPNHSNMCCGEGVCGACTRTGEHGETVRRCKFNP